MGFCVFPRRYTSEVFRGNIYMGFACFRVGIQVGYLVGIFMWACVFPRRYTSGYLVGIFMWGLHVSAEVYESGIFILGFRVSAYVYEWGLFLRRYTREVFGGHICMGFACFRVGIRVRYFVGIFMWGLRVSV